MPSEKLIEEQRKKHNAWNREYRKANKERLTEYNRRYDRENRQERTEKERVRRRTRPDVFYARNVVANAVRYGRLVPPDACSGCGEDKKLQAHHADYAEPMEVSWLCSSCHAAVHCG